MGILSGRTALVTGASRWNGRTSALAFVSRFRSDRSTDLEVLERWNR